MPRATGGTGKPETLPDVTVFDGISTLPDSYELRLDDGTITKTRAPATARAESSRKPALVPCIVDCHVHLTLSSAEAVQRAGVAAVLDLGAPLPNDFDAGLPLRVRRSGPLLTSPGGYPTRTWGANGYGLEVADRAAARDAVATLHDHGACIVKIALQAPGLLPVEIVRTIVEESHARGLRTVAHALTTESVRIVVESGVDALAHAPVEPLPDDLVSALGSKRAHVISTIRAFGASRTARANLARLAESGCTIVYGTDLGNDGIEPGVDPAELLLLQQALSSFDSALASATSVASDFAGFSAGRIKQGEPATMMLIQQLSFEAMRSPLAMWIDGSRVL